MELDEFFVIDLYNGELVFFFVEGYSIFELSDSIYMAFLVGVVMIWDDLIVFGCYVVGIVVWER